MDIYINVNLNMNVHGHVHMLGVASGNRMRYPRIFKHKDRLANIMGCPCVG